mmetsp:Transcript_79938/g.224372  ORF Transcript_79938/g.224372 Transcript_79938/m.224372 type:complete len:243 (-) Transcript_79938:162-890(-)
MKPATAAATAGLQPTTSGTGTATSLAGAVGASNSSCSTRQIRIAARASAMTVGTSTVWPLCAPSSATSTNRSAASGSVSSSAQPAASAAGCSSPARSSCPWTLAVGRGSSIAGVEAASWTSRGVAAASCSESCFRSATRRLFRAAFFANNCATRSFTSSLPTSCSTCAVASTSGTSTPSWTPECCDAAAAWRSAGGSLSGSRGELTSVAPTSAAPSVTALPFASAADDKRTLSKRRFAHLVA